MSFDERGVASLPAAARSESEERAAAPRRAASLLGWADTFGFSAAGSAVDDGLSGRPRVSTVLLGLLLPGILVAVWWSVTTFTDISAVILPSPEQVVLAGVELAENGLLST